ncbi:MAG: glycerate kinase [Bacteroidales bacterium]
MPPAGGSCIASGGSIGRIVPGGFPAGSGWPATSAIPDRTRGSQPECTVPRRAEIRWPCKKLDENLVHWAQLLREQMGRCSGAGCRAAGGLGAGLLAFCGATLEPGFDLVACKCLRAGSGMREADLGLEEALDAQTLFGGVRPGRWHGWPRTGEAGVVAVASTVGEGAHRLYEHRMRP